MSLERYLRDDKGFRKYVVLMETTAPAKRKTLMDAGRAENALFVETAEKYIITFEKITKLPDMELTELLGAPGLSVEAISTALMSVADLGHRERLVGLVPRKILPAVANDMKINTEPKPQAIGNARFQFIQKARELEEAGLLKSFQIPKFERDFFTKKAA